MTRPTHAATLPPLPVTGFGEIDKVHVRLQENMVDLACAIDSGDREQAIEKAVALLVGLRADYACEEALMRKCAYPESERHQASHAVLEIHFTGVSRSIRDAPTPLPMSVQAELQASLRAASDAMSAHVTAADLPLARFLELRGVGR
jgi:hemerythrin